MESKGVGFCTVVMVLGIIAAATGFAGEANRVTSSEVSIHRNSCVYPSSPARVLGIISAVFAIVTQVYISVTFGRCCRNESNSTPISKLFSVFSWVATVAAVILLLAAAGLNNKEGGQVVSYSYFTCYIVKRGIFAAGAMLALLSAFFGIAAYITLTPPPQTITNPAVAIPVGANIDPEKNPMPYPPNQQ